MANADRQTIMEANRALRNIKNELENLLEKGVIDESVYDQIHSTLPEESPLSGPLKTATGAAKATPAPAPAPAPAPTRSQNPTPAPQSETVLFDASNPKSNNPTPSRSPAPPAYSATQPPPPPARKQPGPPPAPQPQFIAYSVARYPYNNNPHQPTGPNDLSFEKGDKIGITEYKNQDWWMGKNLRTNAAGIFPQNHVQLDEKAAPPAAPTRGPVPQYGYPQQPPQNYGPPQPQYGYPQQQQWGPPNGPPPQQNPYNAHVPPMAVAEGSGQQQQQQEGEGGSGKAGEMGKKFGKKLGNAAIFGAGATIGGNIVNSIF